MKLKNLFLMAAIALGAVACSDDNNTPGTEPVALNRTYDGLVSMRVMGEEQGNSFVSFKITSVSDEMVTLTVPKLGRGHMTISSFDIENISVTREGNVYKISKKGSESVVVGETNYKVSDVEGTVENGKADIHLNVTPGSMGMAISFDFTTDYKAADAVVGEWEGVLNMSVGGSTQDPVDMTLTVKKKDDNTVNIITEEFTAMGSMPIPSFMIEDVSVVKSEGNVVTLSKDDFEMVVGSTTTYKFASFAGENGKDAFTLNFVMTPGAMPMPISCIFTTAASSSKGE